MNLPCPVRLSVGLFAWVLCILNGFGLAAQVRVTTSQYDNMRSGANLSESILTPKNVNVRNFGRVSSLRVDGDVYAQPLYLPHVDVPGKGLHDLLFVATENDSVYAFDAGSGSSQPVWHISLLPSPGPSAPVTDDDVQCPFISPNVGITSTPVIDTQTGTLYVLARSKSWKDRSNIRFSQRLHALAITSGAEKFGGPVEIRAAVKGEGVGSSGGEVKFDPLRENPRGSLLLTNNSVYLTWASSCDVGPYHGWVMAYDTRTLRQQAALNTSPDAAESGIWLSDTGPVADQQGNVYVVTGNGRFDASRKGGRDYGDSALRLHLRGGQLSIDDYFTPSDQEQLNSSDGDLGSGGPLLLPGPSPEHSTGLVFGGKAGVLYVVNPERMGRLQSESAELRYQRIKLATGIYSAPAYWNGHLYYFAAADVLKDFPVVRGKLASAPAIQSTLASKYSGGTPTVSSNGLKNGIVWVVETKAWNARSGDAVLSAFDALNVGRELYSSSQNPGRDDTGAALRFVIPTVANGRVYVGVKRAVSVYGLLSQ